MVPFETFQFFIADISDKVEQNLNIPEKFSPLETFHLDNGLISDKDKQFWSMAVKFDPTFKNIPFKFLNLFSIIICTLFFPILRLYSSIKLLFLTFIINVILSILFLTKYLPNSILEFHSFIFLLYIKFIFCNFLKACSWGKLSIISYIITSKVVGKLYLSTYILAPKCNPTIKLLLYLLIRGDPDDPPLVGT